MPPLPLEGRHCTRRYDVAWPPRLGVAAGIAWHGAYQFRRDRQSFHARQLKTVSHTRPPSRESFFIVADETTISEVHEVRVGASRAWSAGGRWRIDARLDAAPTTYARLTTILPLKYPGRDIVFSAPVLTLAPALTVTRRGRWPVTVSLNGLKTFSYFTARQFDRRALTASVTVGLARS